MKAPDLITSKTGKGGELLHVLRRWPFVSELRRMAVVVRHRGPGQGYQETTGGGKDLDRVLALVKGSCDALKPRLVQVPPNLDDMQDQLTKFGFRVLCLAAKELPSDKGMDAELLERDDVESGLQFCGLLVLRNSVKPNTSNTIRQLRQSYHRVIMITGDHPLTACQVAKNVSMAENRFLVLDDVDASVEGLEWKYWDHQVHDKIAFTAGEELRKLARSHTLCVTGAALAKMKKEEVAAVVEVTTVFARVSPQQKEQVVVALNTKSHTVMVGDGTNDVGALKHAHVGISLMTTSIIPRIPTRPHAQKSVNEMLADNGQVPLVRLGDASIASPFTYKGDSIKCSIQVLRSGRATLCSVLMMYKIMGLNSILSAFAMSALTLDGVKLGDGQTAMESLFTSMCFFLVSRSAPAKQLARQQPISSVFAWPVMATLGVQLMIHMAILFSGWQMANRWRAKDFKRDLEGEFAPNLTNTVVFELMAAMHAASFLANYDGHPFMQPLSANRPL
ncbi:Atp13a1, partial [Symbiodinium sp. CCMP2456]